MKRLTVTIFVCALGLTPAVGAEPQDPWLKDIEWYTRPSGDDMARHYPGRASAEEKGGWAILSCRVGGDRRLTGCKVAAEAPEGYGFGAASLDVADEFRLVKPKNGSSLAGRKVRIPIAWSLEGNEGPPKAYPAGEPSMFVSVAPTGASKRQTFPCPSKAEPDQACIAISAKWEVRPEIEDLAELVRKGKDGASALECSVGSAGRLEKCKVSNSSPLTDDEVLAIAGRFQAAAVTEGGEPTDGRRVLLTFDWKILGQALEVFEAT